MDELKKGVFSKILEFITDSPALITLVFGSIVIGVERSMNIEYVCPCDPTWNKVYTAAVFTYPTIAVFVFMITIQNCKCRCKCNCRCGWSCKKENRILSSFVPAFIWVALLFYDGEHFVCAMATRSGKYVKPQDAGDRRRWCQPAVNMTAEEKEMIMQKAHTLYGYSQIISFIPIVVLFLGFLIMYAKKKRKTEDFKCCKDSCCRLKRKGNKDYVCCIDGTNSKSMICESRPVCEAWTKGSVSGESRPLCTEPEGIKICESKM